MISRAYKIPIKTIADANRIKPTKRIEFDSVLFIPGAKRVIDDTSPGALAAKDKKTKTVAVKKGKPADKAKSGKDDRRNRRKALPEDDADQGEKKTGKKLKTDKTRSEKITDKKKSEGEETEKENDSVDEKPTTADGRGKREEDGKKRDSSPGLSEKKADEGKEVKPPASGVKLFMWPVRGRVVSKFGRQPDGMMHNGIRIAARQDRPVVAAARGTVIYSALLKDYGETIILKHEGGYATVYTNLGERVVDLNDRVRQGMKIGLLGKVTGKSEGTMAFEVRYKNKAVNPLRYLK